MIPSSPISVAPGPSSHRGPFDGQSKVPGSAQPSRGRDTLSRATVHDLPPKRTCLFMRMVPRLGIFVQPLERNLPLQSMWQKEYQEDPTAW